MIRAVVDTNVYVSALVFGGKPAAVLQLAESGAFQLVVSATIKTELVDTLTAKFEWSIDRAEQVSSELWDEAYWVVPQETVQVSRDPDDDSILACALEARAEFVITGDQDLLVLHPFRGIAIVTPAEFIARILKQ